MNFWMKNGKLVVDSNGKPILCDHCPCNLCPDISKTLHVVVTGVLECAGWTFTGVNGTFDATWDAGLGSWAVSIGTLPESPGVDGRVILRVYCTDGTIYVDASSIYGTDDIEVIITDSGLIGAALSNINVCNSATAGHSGTVTVTVNP